MMTNQPAQIALFVAAAGVSLAASGVLVVRLERVARRFNLTETALGLLAALAADAPEISSSVAAIVHHDQGIGVGIVVGSNLFNLAALLGLAAILASPLTLGRPLVVIEGIPAIALAVITGCILYGWISPLVALPVVLLVAGPYVALSIVGAERVGRRFSIGRVAAAALEAEAADVDEIVHVAPATNGDVAVAVGSVIAVVGASTAMESSAVQLGSHYQLSSLVVGGLVLAAVTSIPNVVAALYLARRRRAAALVSEASNSNTLNVLFGLAIPAVIIGAGHESSKSLLIGTFYIAMTVFAYAAIWVARGMRRSAGVALVVGYGCFVLVAVLR